MREIVLDTETTGFEPSEGDRIVEIGAVEIFNHLPTGKTYHQYINPERMMPKEAFDVHGLGDDFLRNQPVFAQIGHAFLDFIGDAQLVIHNASFDMKFLNFELSKMGLPTIPNSRATDTLLRTSHEFSPEGTFSISSSLRGRSSTCMSILSRRGPDILLLYLWI